MRPEEKKLILQKEFLDQTGWDKAAIRVYEQIFMAAKNREKLLEHMEREITMIGSPLYTFLFIVSRLEPKTKAILPLSQLCCFFDHQNFLQLQQADYRFYPQLAPHALFLEVYAQVVQEAFAQQTLTHSGIHQFRIYLDRQNIQYVRKKYKKGQESDEQALRQYALSELPEGKLHREPARLHNKFPYGSSYREFMNGMDNKKRVTPNFHSEFIIDHQGHFVSQWDALEKDEQGLVISDIEYYRRKYIDPKDWLLFEQRLLNTESFNYANKNNRIHKNLDMVPVKKLSSNLNKTIVRGNIEEQNHQQLKWQNPVRESWRENCFNYHSDTGDDYSKKFF